MVVGLSGGVDSSVAAAILVEEGYDVVGATLVLWGEGRGEDEVFETVRAAREVASFLGITHRWIDLRGFFQKKVIDYFVEEYRRGRTPNPCVVCNQQVKFSALWDLAKEVGAGNVASGHYGRVVFNQEHGRYTVCRPVDKKKDQSYVLYGLSQQLLSRLLLPLGSRTKEEVRAKAAEWGLPVAQRPESQEICFVPSGDYRSFLKEKLGEVPPGPFLNLKGEKVGEHAGIPFYTIGQRRGLGVALGSRMYVVDIDPRKNAITLGPQEAVLSRGLLASGLNLLLYDDPPAWLEVEAKIRYNAAPAKALVRFLGEGWVRVEFDEPQHAVTPGQAVVFYRGDCLVGGATIEKSYKKHCGVPK